MIELISEGVMFLLSKVFSRVFPDKTPSQIQDLLAEVKPEVDASINAGILKAQATITEKEAGSIFKFVSYARAVLMYVCIAVFIYSEIIVPGVTQVYAYFHHVPPFLPHFDSAEVLNLLYSMLGVSTIHHVMPRTT